MPDLSFEILGAAPARDMLTPALAFDLRIANPFPEQSIQAILLRCQIQIEVARRRYTPAEQAQLRDLFDDPARWSDTLRPMTWAVASVSVPAFTTSILHAVTIPCSFDLTAATAKYFHAIDGGDVPLTWLFSGTVFFHSGSGPLQAAPIPWNKEARFRLPAQTWKDLMDSHYPNAAILQLRRDVFDELYRYKMTAGFATFEETIESMLVLAERPII